MMNKIAIVVFAVAGFVASFVGCSRLGIRGDGVIKTENRPVTGFSKVVVSGAFEVRWQSGNPAVSVSADENLLPFIKTEVSGDTLRIETTESFYSAKTISVVVSSASLEEAEMTGAITFKAANVTGASFTVFSTGASQMAIDGKVEKLEANLTGASKLNAQELQTQSAALSLMGASSANVAVSVELRVSVAGASSVTYSGDPKTVLKNVNGAGSVRRR